MEQKKTAKNKLDPGDLDIIAEHIKELSKLTKDELRKILTPAPKDAIDFLKNNSAKKPRKKHTKKRPAEPYKRTDEEIKQSFGEDENFVVWYYNHIKNSIQTYILRVQTGDAALQSGEDPIISPWNHGQLKTIELLAAINKGEATVKKAYDETMALVKVSYTRHRADRYRKMLLYELKLAADIWAAKICFIDKQLKTRQEVILDANITMDYYNQAIACYQFAIQYNRIIYSTVTMRELYRRRRELILYLQEHPEERIFLTEPFNMEKPRELLYDDKTFVLSEENDLELVKAKQDAAAKERKREEQDDGDDDSTDQDVDDMDNVENTSVDSNILVSQTKDLSVQDNIDQDG